MNCLEARKEFPAFWRRTMPLVARANLIEHLRDCADCDRSFRSFALTAPVVHSEIASDAASSAERPPLNLVRPRRFAASRLERTERRLPERPWKIAAAAALLLMTGVVTAWSSARWPTQNFTESVAGDSSEIDSTSNSTDSTGLSPDTLAPESALFEAVAPPDSSASSDDGI
jgi:hypothetical protein